LTKKISLFLLVLLIVSAIDSIRNLPASALFGSSLIFFFLLSAVIFLIPTSLVAAELSALMPNSGGVYHWMTKAFGDKIGMLAIWLQWINTMVWYPTILSFIAGTFAFLIQPELAENKLYLITCILIIFWGLTIINLFGIEVSTKLNSICGLIGMMFPMALLIILGFIWIMKGNKLQISFNLTSIFPNFKNINSWVSLTAIMASFLGIELSGVHITDINNPQKNFPKAIAYSAFFLITTMLFGSLAISVVLPVDDINLVAGVMQVFTSFFQTFEMSWAIPILTCLIVIGSIGGIINWLISPAKGLLHAAEFGFLHPFFTKKNKYGVAQNILLGQAILVTFFCLIFLLVPSVNAFYWFLTGLSTDLYILMYVLMFLSVLKLHYKLSKRPKSFKIPGKKIGMWTTVLVGLFGCFITLFVSFFPPKYIDISVSRYAFLIFFGNISMIAPVFLFYWYRKKRWRKKPEKPEKLDKSPDTRPIGV
jgi:glutamate:GABA antiporter